MPLNKETKPDHFLVCLFFTGCSMYVTLYSANRNLVHDYEKVTGHFTLCDG